VDAFDVALPHRSWRIERATEKLALRDRLPGANGWDRAAAALRGVYGAGARDHLLALALPTSWMVNARATSRVFQRWLAPPLVDHWRTLIAQTSGGPERWLASTELTRTAVEEAVTALAIEGQGPCAISKALALLVPETVPLMDDAAIAFLTGAIDPPSTADDPKAPAALFVPMLDAFANAVLSCEAQLVEVARAHAQVPLDAPQVLDRLLWVDSWGHRVMKLG
jgi:hypothetical protein